MITAALVLLLLTGILLALFRRPRLGLGVLVAVLGLFWFVGSGRLAPLLLKPLEKPYPRVTAPWWGRRNAVVLLGAGAVRVGAGGGFQPSFMAHSRILEAVRLYRNCRSGGAPCTLIISGGDAMGIGASEAAIYGGEVLALGVAEGDLVLETKSMNTFKNAQFCEPLLKAGGFDRVLLVTSGLHLKRSLLYFSHFGIGCEGAPADHLQSLQSWVPSGYNLAVADLAFHEHLGLLRYRVYNALGWNVKAADKAGTV
jgi:uncharacterized SAM-binding protein YcdF (DUF218 family)